jgi:glycerol-3-phosphate acyltransferase PlsY
VVWGALTWISLTLVSYLIGGIPTAYVATRLLTGQDIRRLGDRNPGAANVYRNVGPAAGLAVATIDVGKGAAAVLLVKGLAESTGLEMLAGVAVMAGHNWPVHLGLRGGRGAATAVGVLLATLPYLAIPISVLTLVILYFSKRAVPCLALLFISIPVLAWPAGYSYSLAAYAVGLAVLVGVSHYLSTHPRASGGPLGPEQKTEQALPQG